MKRGTSLLTKLWRLSVFGALLLVIVEGAIRKWLLPGLSEVVYFAKDGVLLLAYGLFLLAPRERTPGGTSARSRDLRFEW